MRFEGGGVGGGARGDRGAPGGLRGHWHQVIYAVQIDLNTIGNICEFNLDLVEFDSLLVWAPYSSIFD